MSNHPLLAALFDHHSPHYVRHGLGPNDLQTSRSSCLIRNSPLFWAKITELLLEVFSQRYERVSTVVTGNLPFDEWTGVLGSERLTGALLDRLTHYVHILEMNGESPWLK